MIVGRIRYEKRGGHVHCRVFTAPGPGLTFAKCGELVFNDQEWPDVSSTLERAGVEVIPEGMQAALTKEIG